MITWWNGARQVLEEFLIQINHINGLHLVTFDFYNHMWSLVLKKFSLRSLKHDIWVWRSYLSLWTHQCLIIKVSISAASPRQLSPYFCDWWAWPCSRWWHHWWWWWLWDHGCHKCYVPTYHQQIALKPLNIVTRNRLFQKILKE